MREAADNYRREYETEYLRRSLLEPWSCGQQTYPPAQVTQSSAQIRFVRPAGQHRLGVGQIVVCTLAAPATTTAFYQGFSELTCVASVEPIVIHGDIIQATARSVAGQPTRAVERKLNSIESTILEMRPARRSLAEKAQEEPSEFEREYPW